MELGALSAALGALVDASRRFAWGVVLLATIAVALGAVYAARTLSIDANVANVINDRLDWRQRELAFESQFPFKVDQIAIVIDAATPEQAESAASALAAALAPQTSLFSAVFRPDAGPWFEKNGALLLPLADVQSLADGLIRAQPFLAGLAQDPSVRGLLSTLDAAALNAADNPQAPALLEGPLTGMATALERGLAGPPQPFSWSSLFAGDVASLAPTRRFILVKPALDFASLEPGAKATAAIRTAAAELQLQPDKGVTVRLTGAVPLADEELRTVANGMEWATASSLLLVTLLVWLGLRSFRTIAAVMITMLSGLVLTGAFAAFAVGSLNLISVVFAVMFIGIAVDFGIQFSVRFQALRDRGLDEALRETGARVGPSLALAALVTGVGFLTLTPTDFQGVAELGLISAAGMVIAFVLNMTLLPALLGLLRPHALRHEAGFPRLAPIDAALARHRTAALGLGFLLFLGGLIAAGGLRFDFNPLNLRDPNTESVKTLLDLMRDPLSNPQTMDVLAATPEAAQALQFELRKLPEVAFSLSVNDLVPSEQAEKLAVLDEMASVLGPSLMNEALPPPTPEESLLAMEGTAERLLALKDFPAAQRFGAALRQALAAGPRIVPTVDTILVSGLRDQLGLVRNLLEAKPVGIQDMPEDLRRFWMTEDGRARIEIYPREDVTDNEALARFIEAVRRAAPEATGPSVSIYESGRAVVRAFQHSAAYAAIAITVLLVLVLRRRRDVWIVWAPLILAMFITLGAAVLFEIPLNFANIIALPLLPAIGVPFAIYFVMNVRGGGAGVLQTPTARGTLFSALTTAAAFGSLILSEHPGTASMGALLLVALIALLFAVALLLPPLLLRKER
jgi:hopanoid biosynthesis associated RND transporter like protein HpnN